MNQRDLLTILAVICGALTAGCVSIERSMYKGIVVAESFNHHCVRPGADIVLSWSRLDHNPLIPFAYAGWEITLQLSARDLVAGKEFMLPTPSISATLWDIGHHPSEPVKDLHGRIRIVEVTNTYSEISVDLASASKGWAGREEATFYARIPHPKSCLDA